MIFDRCFCAGCNFSRRKSDMYMVLGEIGICRKCSSEIMTTKDMTFSPRDYTDLVVSPFIYSGVILRIVRDFKFGGQRMYGKLLTAAAYEYVRKFAYLENNDIIVPVPLHEKRLSERGFNQSDIIAEGLAKELDIPVIADAASRVRDTDHQSLLRGYDRIKNVSGAFSADREKVDGKKVILVDDIYTVGETTNQCAKALKEAGADKVTVFAVCKTLLGKN